MAHASPFCGLANDCCGPASLTRGGRGSPPLGQGVWGPNQRCPLDPRLRMGFGADTGCPPCPCPTDSPAALWIPRCPVALQNLTLSLGKCVASPQRDKVGWNRTLPFNSHRKVTAKSMKTTKQNSEDNEAVLKIGGSLVFWRSGEQKVPWLPGCRRSPPAPAETTAAPSARAASEPPLRRSAGHRGSTLASRGPDSRPSPYEVPSERTATPPPPPASTQKEPATQGP